MRGNVTLPADLSIPNGVTLTIQSGASLTVPSGVTLANNGTIDNNEGTVANNGTIENNGGSITNLDSVNGPLFTAAPTTDASGNVTFVINSNIEDLESLSIDGNQITMTPSSVSGRWMLSGYPGYTTGYIGYAESGSTKITLYGQFMDIFGAGQHTMSATFDGGAAASTTFTAQTESTGGGLGGEDSGGGCDAGFGAAGAAVFALGIALAGKRGKPRN